MPHFAYELCKPFPDEALPQIGAVDMKPIVTLRDHIEATKVHVFGSGPDYTAARYNRMYSLPVDGRTVGEVLIESDREGAKRRDEIQALAYALVGCGADRELLGVRSMATRGKATPDFEATTHSGNNVRIELCRIVDPAEKQFLFALSGIEKRAQAILEAAPVTLASLGGGAICVRFYDAKPKPEDIRATGDEIAEWLTREVPGTRPSRTMRRVGAVFPTLNRLGAFFARADNEGPPRVEIDPAPRPDFRASTRLQFEPNVKKKAKKVAAYSDGLPTWLVMYVDTRFFIPLGFVEELARLTEFDPRPFDRILVGCFTAGVVFDPGMRPRYISLTSDNEQVIA